MESAPRTTAKPRTAPANADVLTLDQFCAALQISRNNAARLLPEIPHVRIGRNIRIRRAALAEYIARLENAA